MSTSTSLILSSVRGKSVKSAFMYAYYATWSNMKPNLQHQHFLNRLCWQPVSCLLSYVWDKNHFPLMGLSWVWVTPLAHVNKEESSANRRISDDMLSVRSLMYTRKSNGPNIEPCGTPAFKLIQLDSFPFNTPSSTHSFNFVYYTWRNGKY